MNDVRPVYGIIDLTPEEIENFKRAWAETGPMPTEEVMLRWAKFFFRAARVAPALLLQIQTLKMEPPEDLEIMGLTLSQLRAAINFAKSRGWKP